MKTLLVFLLCACVCVGADRRGLLMSKPQAGSSISYLVRQTFEGTGYDNSETWTPTGSPDPDYTGVILQGSQSYRFVQAADAAEYAETSFTSTGTVYGYLILHPIARDSVSAVRIVAIRNSGGSTQMELRIVNTGALRLIHGATTVTTSSTLSDGTTYHVWWRYTPGSGANGVGEVAWSTSAASKPTSGNQYATTSAGTATGDIGNFYLGNNAATPTQDIVMDAVLISTTEIPASPTY